MIYPQVSAKEWMELYNLTPPVNAFCKNCGKRQWFGKPFAYRQFRGLISYHDECGDEFRQSIFVTVNNQDRLALGEFVKRFAEDTMAQQATEPKENK